jgi:hypothetical protein
LLLLTVVLRLYSKIKSKVSESKLNISWVKYGH